MAEMFAWRIELEEAQRENAKLRAENERLKAQDEVRSGAWCNGNMAEGRGPCGICPKCSKANFDRAECAELQYDEAKNVNHDLADVLRALEWDTRDLCPWCLGTRPDHTGGPCKLKQMIDKGYIPNKPKCAGCGQPECPTIKNPALTCYCDPAKGVCGNCVVEKRNHEA